MYANQFQILRHFRLNNKRNKLIKLIRWFQAELSHLKEEITVEFNAKLAHQGTEISNLKEKVKNQEERISMLELKTNDYLNIIDMQIESMAETH